MNHNGKAVARAVGATKIYGSGEAAVRALDDVTVEFPAGRFTAIMGPSGSGKSTLMHCVAGLDSLTSGQVFLGDVELGKLSDKELTLLRREKIGFVFQAFNLVATLTALENITLPMALAGAEPDQAFLDRVIDTVGLRNRLTHRPSELSGGQQQRVAVARALASRPQIIFADEPTGNLDSRSEAEVLDFLRGAVNDLGQTIVMVTHDPVAAGYADEALFLSDGKIVDSMEKLASKVADLPEVKGATGFGVGAVRIGDDTESVGVAEPGPLARVLDLDESHGSIEDLGGNEFAASADKADKEGWKLGSVVSVTFLDGTTQKLRLGAIYESADVAGPLVLTRASYDPHAQQSLDQVVFVVLAGGVGLEDGKAAVKDVAEAFGSPKVEDKQQFLDTVAGGVNQMLAMVYVMLTLAILIALMGIANTLSLSIFERTRELGLLRAVGKTRGQLRSMVRWESVVIATFGTVGGLAVGIFLGWALVLAASSEGIASFAAPPGQMAVVLVVGAIVGVLAGLRPALRAAKLNVLAAIATD